MSREKDRQKFVQLAEARVTRALKDIKLIGNLSNRSNYVYTDEDAKNYCSSKKAVDETKSRFETKGRPETETFKLEAPRRQRRPVTEVERAAAKPIEMRMSMKPNWVWEPVPSSGKRSGGRSAERLFQGGIDSLVRESIQNSIDARQNKKGMAEINITVVELFGDELEDFLAAIAWEDIRDNLVAEKRKSSQMISAVEKLESDGHLLCLRIEDHKTWGLTGTEDRDEDSEKTATARW